MTFTVAQKDEITVYHNESLFFKAIVKNGIKFNLQFFKDDNLILETNSLTIIFFKKVWIKEQKLPYDIEFAKQKGLWGFVVAFRNHLIYSKLRPLQNPAYRFYLDEQLIAEVHNGKGITTGRHYIVSTTTEDEILNLYLLIAFVIQFIPL